MIWTCARCDVPFCDTCHPLHLDRLPLCEDCTPDDGSDEGKARREHRMERDA